jgi:hypothetical protein
MSHQEKSGNPVPDKSADAHFKSGLDWLNGFSNLAWQPFLSCDIVSNFMHEFHIELFKMSSRSGMPDFSWYKIPNWRKYTK